LNDFKKLELEMTVKDFDKIIEKSYAEISINYDSKKHAESVAKSVSPDNLRTPLGLEVETSYENMTVITKITSKKNLETLLSTIDDLLSCVQIAERVINSLKVADKRQNF
jgi:hypothetical protein